MARPAKPRILRKELNAFYFKPEGISHKILTEEIIKPEELEAIRLCDCKNLMRIEAAKKMQISRQTFGRILKEAHKKIANALIYGKAIKIEKDKN